MVIKTSRDAMIFEHEQFKGKRLYIRGELFSKGFYILESSLSWLEYDEKIGMEREKPVEEAKKFELISLIKNEARKKNFNLITWENTM